MHTGFSLETLEGRDHSQDPGIDWIKILKWMLREIGLLEGVN
jgi:hypothetical protein